MGSGVIKGSNEEDETNSGMQALRFRSVLEHGMVWVV